jgi:hypothetical protein
MADEVETVALSFLFSHPLILLTVITRLSRFSMRLSMSAEHSLPRLGGISVSARTSNPTDGSACC